MKAKAKKAEAPKAETPKIVATFDDNAKGWMTGAVAVPEHQKRRHREMDIWVGRNCHIKIEWDDTDL